MARWADYPSSEDEAAMLSLLERLVGLKPQGWSAVRGDSEVVLRPAERGLIKCSITVSPTWPEPTFAVSFHSRARSVWVARLNLPLAAERAVSILA